MLALAMLYKGRDSERCDELLGDIELPDDFMDVDLIFRIRLAIAERLVERDQLDDAAVQLSSLTSEYPGTTPDQRSVLAHRALARVYDKKGFSDSAALCHGSIARQFRALLGDAHPLTLEKKETEAVALAETIRMSAALASLRASLAMKDATLGTHPSIYATKFRLAVLLYGELEYKEADELFDEAMVGMETWLGGHHPLFLDAKEELAACFAGRAQRTGVGGKVEKERTLEGHAVGLLGDVLCARREIGMDTSRTEERLRDIKGGPETCEPSYVKGD